MGDAIQARGIIKILKSDTGGDPLEETLSSITDTLTNAIPYGINLINWATVEIDEQGITRKETKAQQVLTEIIDDGYMFFAEDVQVIVHGKNTENFQTTNGGNTSIQTNQETYRELTCKTTISERDLDLEAFSETGQAVRNKDNVVWAILQDAWNQITTDKIVKDYLNKRKKFLMDLDGAEVFIYSSLLPSVYRVGSDDSRTVSSQAVYKGNSTYETGQVMKAKMNSITLSVPSGQFETVYELKFVEVSDLEDQSGSNTEDAIEPGTVSF